MSKNSRKGSGSGASAERGGSGDESEDRLLEDKAGVAPQDVLGDIVAGKEQLIHDWYEQINKEPPKIDAFLDPNNVAKNRFKGVLLYDRSRVIIKDKHGSDYYHASFVDSYEKKDGYILAQAPFDESTEADFWRMVFKLKPVTIVLLGSLLSADGTPRMKGFWPHHKGQERQYVRGYIRVRCINKDQERAHDFYEFILLGSGQRTKQGFRIQMLQNRKWVEDKEVPDNLIDFRAALKIAIARAGNENHAGVEGAVLIVCPTGVHRAGTFAALDILCARLMEERKVGLDETVAVIRSQRYGAVAHFGHYKVLHELVVHQAIANGLVDVGAVAGRKR